MGSFIELKAADGHAIDAWVAEPQGTARGAVLVVQEIFGVNSHIRAVADGYAADGWLAVAPAFYDRAKRHYETGYSQEDIQAGMAIAQSLNPQQTVADITAAFDYGQRAGKVGILGYCWGGTMSWLAAARLPGLACAVPFYGGGMPGLIGEKPQCPVMCHFGEKDQHPSAEQARAIAAAHPEITAHFYDAGHGFNCDQRASYDAAASSLARQRTVAFLRQHVG